MALTIRRTHGPSGFKALWQQYVSLHHRVLFSTFGLPAIGNGTTAGRLRTNASTIGRVAGVEVTKASTDDLWNLSGETATTASQFRAYWLYINAAGTASFVAGANAASAAAALEALPALDEAKCVFGVYVAGVSTNFANALAAQGTIYNGIPAGANLGGGLVYSAPQIITASPS
jgi:hypothetical protein